MNQIIQTSLNAASPARTHTLAPVACVRRVLVLFNLWQFKLPALANLFLRLTSIGICLYYD